MNEAWKWRPERTEGIWRHGCAWAKPFTAAAPWISLALLMATFALADGRLTSSPGTVFGLPAPAAREGTEPGLAAIMMPVAREGAAGRETMVFFDDARYSLDDDASREALRERIGARAAADATGTMLVLADARVPAGDMILFAGLAREAGVVYVEIAERRE
ncbi:MAG: hypothetical protein IKL96_00330 [Kiritimatiellae bacterium]|nr:hypothetical protein [Kiritimatiellia bacterium]